MSADEEYLEDLMGTESSPQDEGAAEETGLNEETLLEDFEEDIFSENQPEDFTLDENVSEDKGTISPDEIDAMFAAANAAAFETNDISTDSVLGDGVPADTLSGEELPDDDIFDFFGDMPEEEEEAVNKEAAEIPETGDEPEPLKKKKREKKDKKEKKERKGLKALFGKKKEEEQNPEEGEEKAGEDAADETGEPSVDEATLEEDGKAKPQGFFSRLISFLTEADDEAEEENQAEGLEPSDENKSILKELDDEDKKKKKKKVKGKKGGEEGEEGEEKKKKKKEKKKAKEKKESPVEAEPAETGKKGKKVSVKSIALVTGFSLTFAAMIMVICSIIPVFFEKRAARDAFYGADYAKSYELLYGKKLDESDEMIYNKSKTILEMRRKLDSYHNYLGIGKEVQALDALISGIEKYPEILAKAEEYRVVQEVNAIYESILNILSDKYSLDEALAWVIIGYDDVTYTKKLESVVYGTSFTEPQQKSAEPVAADILPEEQVLEEEIPAEIPEDTSAENESVSEQNETGNVNEEENVQEEFPSSIDESSTQEDNASSQEQNGQQISVQEPEIVLPGGGSSGEDVSTWTGDSSYGSQGEQIQGICQPIGIEIHGN